MLGPQHPRITRRTAVQAGAIGILGLGMNHLAALRAASAAIGKPAAAPARSVIFIFLSGGLSQHESFDMKPDAPDGIRGDFRPIATRTPGVNICEHLPRLAERSEHWSLVRSLTHRYNEHSNGHLAMLCAQSEMPAGFDPNQPKPTDCPAIAAVAGAVTQPRNNLPPAVVLPERLIHFSGRVIPGQFAGIMGSKREPWFLEYCRYNAKSYGAYPEYGFHHERGAENPAGFEFQAPHLTLAEGLDQRRLQSRAALLDAIGHQQRALDQLAEQATFDRYRERAISLLADSSTRAAFDVSRVDDKTQERYGRNTFGWSLLVARQLVEAGVNLVQVNLGNDETWDTHQSMFPNLKNFLFPPTDRAVSALLDDLHDRGLLESTLVVMAGEFGRTPKISSLGTGKLPGRDHWGAVQTVFFAGGGVRGGNVIGSSDKIGGHPQSDPQKPENFAATIYRALGIPQTAVWHDQNERPHMVYAGEPIPGLLG
jgi:uncharacterized protein (DUF1501 family)